MIAADKAPVIHSTIVLERTFHASPARLFAAWADPQLKARWFIGPDSWREVKRSLDFRVGGDELLHGTFADGRETKFSARYLEVVADARLVYVYDMHYAGSHLSASLVTVEIRPAGSGAALLLTEQVAFLNGEDGTASRERGNAAHLDRIGALL
jgi:uncharacterized protein YndB with AHSA1/START domain